MGNIFLYQKNVEGLMKFMGKAIAKGVDPVHCRVYWEDADGLWMTQLVKMVADKDTEVVGKGDGYNIHITRVEELLGEKMEGGDSTKLNALARSYGSTKNGDLSDSNSANEREWSNEPQGYGGPPYDHRITSNTYVWWLLLKSGVTMPAEPAGSVGWGHHPKFPRPK